MGVMQQQSPFSASWPVAQSQLTYCTQGDRPRTQETDAADNEGSAVVGRAGGAADFGFG